MIYRLATEHDRLVKIIAESSPLTGFLTDDEITAIAYLNFLNREKSCGCRLNVRSWTVCHSSSINGKVHYPCKW
jgi:hypothetical protein